MSVYIYIYIYITIYTYIHIYCVNVIMCVYMCIYTLFVATDNIMLVASLLSLSSSPRHTAALQQMPVSAGRHARVQAVDDDIDNDMIRTHIIIIIIISSVLSY